MANVAQAGESDPPRPDRMRSGGGRSESSARYNEEPSHERASQDLRAYLEQKKQRSKRPGQSQHSACLQNFSHSFEASMSNSMRSPAQVHFCVFSVKKT